MKENYKISCRCWTVDTVTGKTKNNDRFEHMVFAKSIMDAYCQFSNFMLDKCGLCKDGYFVSLSADGKFTYYDAESITREEF